MYHTSPISGIACSPCGDYIATAGYDNKVILWNSTNHLPLAVGMHDHLANQVVFSRNGQLLASSSSDYTVRIWSVPDMKLLTVMHHSDDVEGICFSHNDKFIATASRDRHVRVFSVNGHLVNDFSGHRSDVLTVDWLDDMSLISCGDDSSLRYWDTKNNTCDTVIDLGGMETDTLCISSTYGIFSGNDDGDIVHFDKHGCFLNKHHAHKSGIKRIVLLEDKIISLSYDRELKIWNIAGGNIALQHRNEIPNIVWPRSCAPINSHLLAFATFGDRYALYDSSKACWLISSIQHTNGVNSVYPVEKGLYYVGDSGRVYFNGNMVGHVPSLCNFVIRSQSAIICGGQDGAIYDALQIESLYHHSSPLNCVTAFSLNDESYIAVGAYSGDIIILKFDLANEQYSFFKAIKLHTNAIKGICINENKLFTVCADNIVSCHEIYADLSITEVFSGKHDKIVNGCHAFRNGFVSVSRDLTLRFWGDEEKTLTTPHKNSIKCVATDGERYVITGDYRGSIGIYDNDTGTYEHMKISIRGISSLKYDEYSGRVIATSYDGKLHDISLKSLFVKERKYD